MQQDWHWESTKQEKQTVDNLIKGVNIEQFLIGECMNGLDKPS
jgi:hypothetical protein